MQARKKKIECTFELYLNAGGRIVFGKTGAQILEAVEEHGSMVMAAKKLEMSYRFQSTQPKANATISLTGSARHVV